MADPSLVTGWGGLYLEKVASVRSGNHTTKQIVCREILKSLPGEIVPGMDGKLPFIDVAASQSALSAHDLQIVSQIFIDGAPVCHHDEGRDIGIQVISHQLQRALHRLTLRTQKKVLKEKIADSDDKGSQQESEAHGSRTDLKPYGFFLPVYLLHE